MKGFFAAVCLAFMAAAGGLIYLFFFQADTHAPAIIVTDRTKRYVQGMSEAELLTGVTAIDDRSGDVTSTLMVQEVHPGSRDGTVDVTYSALDRENNVGTLICTLRVEGEKTAESPDTDRMTDAEEEEGPAQEEPTDESAAVSAEAEALMESYKAEQEAKIQELDPRSPKIYLTQYYTELPHGTEFSPLSFVEEIEDDVDNRDLLFTRIQINGIEALNMDVPGSYDLGYFVLDSEGNQSNLAYLTVRVV